MKNLCIYHKQCKDGFGAALAVKVYFDKLGEKCEFMPAHYGEPIPDVTGKNVVIVDFSYPREVLIDMQYQANSIVVLDHHKTAKDNLEGLDFCHFDMNRSGAMMAWEYFHPNEKVPQLIKFIQDRDLWKWEMDYSKEFSAGLGLIPLDFSGWETLLDNTACLELIDKGKTILRYQEQQIKRAVSRNSVRKIILAGYEVPIINTATLVSEICGKLAESYPFAVSYFDTAEDRVYSLRSRNKEGIDVSKVAKMFDGGGHKNASGFSIPLNKKQL